MRTYLSPILLASLLATGSLALSACDDDSPFDSSRIARINATLLSFESCEELDERIRPALYDQIDYQAERYREIWSDLRRDRSFFGGDFGYDEAAGVGAADDADRGASAPPTSHTETNTQVAGVDEPDFVKTDGERIYIAHPGGVGVYRSWPPEALGEADFLPIDEHATAQLLLTPEHLIAISPLTVPHVASPGYGGYPHPIPGMGSIDIGGVDEYYYEYYATHTRVRVYARHDGEHELISDHIYSGRYREARRHEQTVRVLLNSAFDPLQSLYYAVPAPDPWASFSHGRRAERRYNRALDEWVSEAKAYVDELSISALLPHEYIPGESDANDEIVPMSCGRLYTPELEQDQRDLLSVLTFSLDEPDAVDHLALVGGAGIVYASHDRLLSSRYGWDWDPETNQSFERSVLHSFVLGERSTRYEASGLLEGRLRNQFSLDVHNEIIRAAISFWDHTPSSSSTTSPWADGNANKLVTLKPEDGALVRVGETPPLARGETIFSVRFMGDYGYIVTFRQVDPLFAIDLRDPANPKVLGELKIPGFSTYMHPLSADHLLTIGRDVDEHSGMDQGLQLQIFDVSDKTNPLRIHQRTLPKTYSQAEHNHKAFVYDARLKILTLATDSWAYDDQPSALRLFSVSIEDGFGDEGSITHEGLPSVDDYYYHRMRRGLFIEDLIYSISHAGMMVHALGDPLEEIARLAFD